MTKVNVAKLKSELSKYLEIVQQGEVVVITSHGTEVARLVPHNTTMAPPVNWAEFLKDNKPLKSLKKPMSSGKLVRQIRDEE